VDALLNVLRLPGETATAWLGTHTPGFAEFLRIDDGTNQATLVITLSVLAWIAAALLLGFIIEKIRDFDRTVTSYLSGRYAEAGRQLRILRRRLASAIGAIREREQAPTIAVTEINLERHAATVLRCYGSAGDLRSLSASDVATRLKLSLREVEQVLRGLMEHQLVERAFGTDEGREGHRITQAGQIYLLER
jgi:hypothetical protein